MAARPDKIYFNITINYNENKKLSNERPTSKAYTEIEVLDPIIEHTNLYDMCISKFRLDTFSVPLVIPELKQPQKIVDKKIELNFWVKLLQSTDTLYSAANTPKKETGTYTLKETKYLELIPKRFNGNYRIDETVDDDTKAFHSIEEGFSYKKPCVRKYKTKDADGNEVETDQGFIDNLDPFCYIYEPQEFVDSMNRALMELVRDYDNRYFEASEIFFKLESGKLTFYQKKHDVPYIIVFSGNLYRYFGFMFNTKQVPEHDGWMICNDADTRNIFNKCEDSQLLGTAANPEFNSADIDNFKTTVEGKYNIAKADVEVTQTWNAMKTILVCSNSLPVKGEYVPISEGDGLLIHENTEVGRKNYLEYHNYEKDNSNLGEPTNKTPSIKVLESYYPLSDVGGDLRTQIIYSNDSIDTGTKLSMRAQDNGLRKFDIQIKWVDIFNNMHDLELFPNTSCDIRLAFVKKGAKQDLIVTGFKHVLSALNYKYQPEYKKKRIVSSAQQLPGYGFKFLDLDDFD